MQRTRKRFLSYFIAQVIGFLPVLKPSGCKRLLLPPFLLASVLLVSGATLPQTPVPIIDRGHGREMLQNVKEALKELYYDPAYHGMNVDARFKEAERQINEAKSTWQINAIIAQVLSELNDSHTAFLPPDLVVGVNYGFQMQMIGDACYVVRIKPDAEKKGLKVGDVIYAIEGYEPTRESLWKIIYSYFVLQPQPSLRLTIQEPGGRLRELAVEATISKKKMNKVEFKEGSEKPPQYFDLSDDAIACKLVEFDLSDKEVDEMMKRIRTRKVLILDLRGNPGGTISMEQRVLGYFFDRDVKIGDQKERKKTSPLIAKTRGEEKVFKGKVFVLVDSKSASAAEIFARMIQLETRGTVIGDRTAGAVMGSVQVPFFFRSAAAQQTVSSLYGATITVADLIMSDGKSLEHTGVTPDVLLLPKGQDLASKLDPVLAYAASLAGVQLDPAKAGSIFPPKDDEDDLNNRKKK